MPDFSKLMSGSIADAPRPVALPIGVYKGVITKYELREAPQGKDYTAVIRLHIGLIAWPEDVDQETVAGIDLSKRTQRRDFYDNAMYRLGDLMKSCGVEEGLTFEQGLTELQGKHVDVEIQQYTNQRSGELGNQVGAMTGSDE